MNLTEELIELLYKSGAALVGIGDISVFKESTYNVGVSVAVSVPKKIVVDLKNEPTKEYYDAYFSLNERLNNIVRSGENY